MRANSLWRTLPLHAKTISLLPIVMLIFTSVIFLFGAIGARAYQKSYYVIGFVLWLAILSFIIINLRSESTEKRPAGFYQVPAIALIAFNIVVLCLNLFTVYYLGTPYNWGYFVGFDFIACGRTIKAGLMMAWGLSFSLSNLLLHISYAQYWVLEGKRGALARHFSLFNGLIAFAVSAVSVAITFIGYLCAGPGS